MLSRVTLDQRLVDAAIDQLTRRWPEGGWHVAAAVYLDDGEILTSVGLDNLHSGAGLCAETGALIQAYTMDRAVTASACVCRDEQGAIAVLAPCGICQERLALWGPAVQVAVADGTGWATRTLGELHPYYWGMHFGEGGQWPSTDVHTS
jgi:cytidine deaminase